MMIKKAFELLDSKQKRHQFWLVIIALIGSVFELIGVSAVLPLMQLLMDNESTDNAFSNELLKIFHASSKIQLITIFIVLIIAIFVIKNIYLLFQTWYISKNCYEIQFGMTQMLMERYMKASYSYFTKHNTSEIQMNLIKNTSSLGLVFQYGMQLTTEIIVSIVLIGFMLVANPSLTVSVTFIISIGTFSYSFFTRRFLGVLGKKNQENDQKLIQWINQAIGGIKEVIIFNRAEFFLNRINNLSTLLKTSYTNYLLLIQSPHYVSEMLCMSSVLLAILIQVNLGADIDKLITQLAAFAVAAFRLLPSLGKINGLIGNLQFNTAAVEVLTETIKKLEEDKEQKREQDSTKIICFRNSIYIKNLSFYYDKEETILNNLNLEVKKGESTAFIGPSGAGKSTLVDLILGVIVPIEGDVLIDGTQSIYSNICAWQKNIGYIPQFIFLSDDTIRNNIAFGVDSKDIDDSKIIKALKQAQLEDYVLSLPEGLDTIVGERGVRLSGGQRQRIGIARALYNDPEILVMDEATSALDNETEIEVMGAINCLYGMKTIIIIAHRLSTIENCDRIYEIKDKSVCEVTDKFHN